ncbi:unnamed protein product [Boreogadus saida]
MIAPLTTRGEDPFTTRGEDPLTTRGEDPLNTMIAPLTTRGEDPFTTRGEDPLNTMIAPLTTRGEDPFTTSQLPKLTLNDHAYWPMALTSPRNSCDPKQESLLPKRVSSQASERQEDMTAVGGRAQAQPLFKGGVRVIAAVTTAHAARRGR